MSAVLSVPDEAAQRAAVCAEAREWLGTKYHPHGRIKGVGVDCANLLCCVYEIAGIAPPIDPGFYPTGWHLHRNEEVFIERMREAGARPVTSRTPRPGDLGLWRFGRTYSHAGIVVSDDGLIVHAYLDAGVICTRMTEEPLGSRPAIFWTLWS